MLQRAYELLIGSTSKFLLVQRSTVILVGIAVSLTKVTFLRVIETRSVLRLDFTGLLVSNDSKLNE